MTESSVIKHYKKQLIYRQHDLPDLHNDKRDTGQLVNELSNTKIYDFVEAEATTNGKKIRRKRKNKNCRGQFRHEAMELIKLGTNPSHTLCKSKELFTARSDKAPLDPTPQKDDATVPQHDADNLTTTNSVIQSTFVDKTVPNNLSPKEQPFGHALPQMVPERRNSRELPAKVPVIYRSPPPRLIHQPEYGVPVHPPYSIPHPSFPHPHPLPYRPIPRGQSPSLPPPPYPLSLSPPRSVSRSPVRPIPIQRTSAAPPYSGIHFPFPRHLQASYSNGYHPPVTNPPIPNPNTSRVLPPQDYPERKKRKHPDNGTVIKDSPPVVAAIDLTVDQNQYGKVDKVPQQKHHKCHCECGKTYSSDPVTQEVIITVNGRNTTQVPSSYMRGKMVNGVLQFEQSELNSNGLKRHQPNVATNVESPVAKDNKTPETKLPQLFLIEDLLSKGVKFEKKSVQRREDNNNFVQKPKGEVRTTQPVSVRTESNRVIVSTKPAEKPVPKPQAKDYSVSNIIGNGVRRQSVDVDTISISSSGSESVRSPRPRSTTFDKQVPHGKLFYYKNNNSFIRYFDDTQKKLFINSITADGNELNHGAVEEKEIIELPKNTMFSSKDNLTVEEYVFEMTLVEKFIPKDFFLFYKFVTGYQICNNNLPVSFLTFLKVYNTNGLKVLLERYVSSLKQN